MDDINPTVIITGRPLNGSNMDARQNGMSPDGADPQPSAAATTSSDQTTDVPPKTAPDKVEVRKNVVVRDKGGSDGMPGAVNVEKSKKKARNMINKGEGVRLRTARQTTREPGEQMILLSGLKDGNAIKMNLLSKSGLRTDRVMRDLNVLEDGIKEATFHLRNEDLTDMLNQHLGLDQLKPDGKKSADGCTVAALLMMNAAMLHQRIGAGRWMAGIPEMSAIKSDVNVIKKVCRAWERIMNVDFQVIFGPALEVAYAIEETGKTAGLERALHHIAGEAERIAETYADMGADHAGPLFNRVMGNQASDGAYFTRPIAASLAARLTLDAYGDADWTDPDVWRDHKTADLACGSGTLLSAILSDMKRRAKEMGADKNQLARLQKTAVEDVIKGMDVNPVSLQLAAAQLTMGNKNVRYKKMGLWLMPYGPDKYNPGQVSAGTLELLGQNAIVRRRAELDTSDPKIASQSIWEGEDIELENAVEAARGARIIIMNPPFTNREKMGEKFPKDIQRKTPQTRRFAGWSTLSETIRVWLVSQTRTVLILGL